MKLKFVFWVETGDHSLIVEKSQTVIEFSDEMLALIATIAAKQAHLDGLPKGGRDAQVQWLQAFNDLLKARRPLEETLSAAADMIVRFCRPKIIEFIAK